MTVSILNQEDDTIYDPVTGEHVDVSDADALAEAYVRLDATRRDVSAAMTAIRQAFGVLAKGDSRTRRVRGDRHRVRVEMPPTSWNQSKLKLLWKTWPSLAPEFIRVDRFAPNLVEVRKLREESGGSDFSAFRKLLLEAEEPPTQPPRIFLETSTETEMKEQEWSLRKALKASVQDDE